MRYHAVIPNDGIPLSPAVSAEVTSSSLYASTTLVYAVHGAASIGALTGLGVAALNIQGALTTLADKYPPLRTQVAVITLAAVSPL